MVSVAGERVRTKTSGLNTRWEWEHEELTSCRLLSRCPAGPWAGVLQACHPLPTCCDCERLQTGGCSCRSQLWAVCSEGSSALQDTQTHTKHTKHIVWQFFLLIFLIFKLASSLKNMFPTKIIFIQPPCLVWIYFNIFFSYFLIC